MLTVLQNEKQILRQQMRAKRLATPDRNIQSFKALHDVFLRNLQLDEGAVVASYRAFRGEMDAEILTDALRRDGHKIALPVIVGKRLPLLFRIYEPSDRLVPNAMGIAEPETTAPAVEPDILLVPLLAFDRNCNRLGYGGGYYDRTIKELRRRKPILAVGIAFSFQEVPAVPVGDHDIPLDRIVTELNIF